MLRPVPEILPSSRWFALSYPNLMALLFGAIITAICVSFFCSLLEACLLSLSNADIAAINEKKPAVASIWRKFKDNIQKPIAVILIVNTLSYTIGAAVAGAQFSNLFGTKWIGLFSFFLSLALFQWTEILPKTLAVRYRQTIAMVSGFPLRFMVRAFSPFVALTGWLNKPFEGKKQGETSGAVNEIALLARFAALTEQITREQESIISRSMDMSTLTVRDIMVERANMNILSTRMTLQDGLIAAHVHRHTRYPLAQSGDPDNIIGYVNFKDIVGALRINQSNPTLEGICRPVVFIAAWSTIPELLKKLTHGYQHMAIVQDERKKTLGLVTLENVIEIIVGQLEDEYDTPPDYVVQLSEHRFRVGGGVALAQLHKQISQSIPNTDQPLSDWMAPDGKMISQKETSDIIFRVRKVTRGKIHDVILERKNPA